MNPSKKKKSPMRSVEEIIARLDYLFEYQESLEAQLKTSENIPILREKLEALHYAIGELEFVLKIRDSNGKFLGVSKDLKLPFSYMNKLSEEESEENG